MLINLRDIGEISSDFNFRLPRNIFLRLEDKLHFEEISCAAKLSKNRDIVYLKGEYRVTLSAKCDFCLAETTLDMERRFDLTLAPESHKDSCENDLEVSLGSPDVEYYTGQEICLERRFEDQLILDLPMSISCSEECRGLCGGCGINLNNEACQCQRYRNNPFYVLNQL